MTVQESDSAFFRNVGPPIRVFEFSGWACMIQRLRYYGDDTGMHGAGICGVAGYLATAENWEHFRKEWESALQEPKAVAYFKRGPNYHGDDPFTGWTDDERQAKLYQMISVFARYRTAIRELSSTISWSDYNTAVSGPLKEIYHSPYFFCFHGVVSLVVDEVRKLSASVQGVEPVIDFVFDQEDEFALEAHTQYVRVYDQYPELAKYMGGCLFKDDKRTAELQAADLIAWQIRRDLVRPPEDNNQERPELRWLRSLYGCEPKMRKWRASGIAQFVAAVK